MSRTITGSFNDYVDNCGTVYPHNASSYSADGQATATIEITIDNNNNVIDVVIVDSSAWVVYDGPLGGGQSSGSVIITSWKQTNKFSEAHQSIINILRVNFRATGSFSGYTSWDDGPEGETNFSDPISGNMSFSAFDEYEIAVGQGPENEWSNSSSDSDSPTLPGPDPDPSPDPDPDLSGSSSSPESNSDSESGSDSDSSSFSDSESSSSSGSSSGSDSLENVDWYIESAYIMQRYYSQKDGWVRQSYFYIAQDSNVPIIISGIDTTINFPIVRYSGVTVSSGGGGSQIIITVFSPNEPHIYFYKDPVYDGIGQIIANNYLVQLYLNDEDRFGLSGLEYYIPHDYASNSYVIDGTMSDSGIGEILTDGYHAVENGGTYEIAYEYHIVLRRAKDYVPITPPDIPPYIPPYSFFPPIYGQISNIYSNNYIIYGLLNITGTNHVLYGELWINDVIPPEPTHFSSEFCGKLFINALGFYGNLILAHIVTARNILDNGENPYSGSKFGNLFSWEEHSDWGASIFTISYNIVVYKKNIKLNRYEFFSKNELKTTTNDDTYIEDTNYGYSIIKFLKNFYEGEYYYVVKSCIDNYCTDWSERCYFSITAMDSTFYGSVYPKHKHSNYYERITGRLEVDNSSDLLGMINVDRIKIYPLLGAMVVFVPYKRKSRLYGELSVYNYKSSEDVIGSVYVISTIKMTTDVIGKLSIDKHYNWGFVGSLQYKEKQKISQQSVFNGMIKYIYRNIGLSNVAGKLKIYKIEEYNVEPNYRRDSDLYGCLKTFEYIFTGITSVFDSKLVGKLNIHCFNFEGELNINVNEFSGLLNIFPDPSNRFSGEKYGYGQRDGIDYYSDYYMDDKDYEDFLKYIDFVNSL